MHKNKKNIIYIVVTIIFIGVFLMFGNRNFDNTNNVKIVEKTRDIENISYEVYTNKTNFSLNLNMKDTISNIKSDVIIPDIEIVGDEEYKRFLNENDLGLKLTNNILKENINISDIELNSILRLQDNMSKVGNIITKETIFEIPLNTNILGDEFSTKLIKFNLEKNTITVKEKKDILEDWNIVYSGYLNQEFLLSSYVFDIFYLYSEVSNNGYIAIKTIDTEGIIRYHMIGVGFNKDNSIKILTNQNEFFNNKLNLRSKCIKTNVIKEVVYQKENQLNIMCVLNDREIYTDTILF